MKSLVLIFKLANLIELIATTQHPYKSFPLVAALPRCHVAKDMAKL